MYCSAVFGFCVFVSLRICVLVFIEIIGRRPAMQNAFHLLLHLYYPIRRPPFFFAFFHFLPNTNENTNTNTYVCKYKSSTCTIRSASLNFSLHFPLFALFAFFANIVQLLPSNQLYTTFICPLQTLIQSLQAHIPQTKPVPIGQFSLYLNKTH